MSQVIHVTADSFKEVVLLSPQPVLVDFWASWCSPCRMLGPVIEELAEDFEDTAVICKLDVDAEGALAAQYGVMSIPTVILFRGGSECQRIVGVRSKDAYAEELNGLI